LLHADYLLPCLPHAFLQAVLFTDNVSFLHIRNYTNEPFGLDEARSVTLIAPEGARINNIPLGVLRSMQQPTNSSSSSSNDAAAAAAQGDGAGIVTVTDSYILGATNVTLLPLLRRLGGQETQQPLLLLIQSNVTLAPAAWGDVWPEGGLQVLRPTIWAGSSWQMTSIDFGMEVGQVRGSLLLLCFPAGCEDFFGQHCGVSLQLLRPTIWAGSSWQMTSIDFQFGMEVGQVRASCRWNLLLQCNHTSSSCAAGAAELSVVERNTGHGA
jgi:hypothetical protein